MVPRRTISLGIGQGYNNFTILQLAVATATLANNGLKMKPHLVREVVDIVTREPRPAVREPAQGMIAKAENIAVIRNALVGVNIEGTSASSFRGAQYTSGGKTGTAQVIQIKQGEKYDASKIDERHRDHALYMAYAPAEEPTIALAMVVENAGFGAQNAAPIARRVFDYWILNQYPNDEDVAAVQKAQAYTPLGKPRAVSELAWPAGSAATPAGAASGAMFAPVAVTVPAAAPASAPASGAVAVKKAR